MTRARARKRSKKAARREPVAAPLLLPGLAPLMNMAVTRKRPAPVLKVPPSALEPEVDAPARPRRHYQIPLWRMPLRRPKAPKPKSIGKKPLTKAELDMKRRLDHLDYPSLRARRKLPVLQKPEMRSGCAVLPRPCPFIHCRANNYLTETADGVLKKTYPDLEPHQMDPDYSCSEDVIDRGGATVEEVSYALNMTDERTRQLTVSAFRKIKATPYGRELYELYVEGRL